jgi:hypothetical protein
VAHGAGSADDEPRAERLRDRRGALRLALTATAVRMLPIGALLMAHAATARPAERWQEAPARPSTPRSPTSPGWRPGTPPCSCSPLSPARRYRAPTRRSDASAREGPLTN